MLYDVMTRYGHKIALFCVHKTWCASAYNKDDLTKESRDTRFWCLERDCAYNEYAYNECVLYMVCDLNEPLETHYQLRTIIMI